MNNILIVITYIISSEGSKIYDNMNEKNGIILLNQNIEYLKYNYPDCYLFFAGDFNARTNKFLDYIPNDS